MTRRPKMPPLWKWMKSFAMKSLSLTPQMFHHSTRLKSSLRASNGTCGTVFIFALIRCSCFRLAATILQLLNKHLRLLEFHSPPKSLKNIWSCQQMMVSLHGIELSHPTKMPTAKWTILSVSSWPIRLHTSTISKNKFLRNQDAQLFIWNTAEATRKS